MDKIIINGLRLFAFHGVNEEEKINGQNFCMDISLSLDLSKPCASDKLEDTVSYSSVIKKVRAAFCEKSFDLLERAAQRVCGCIFDSFPAVCEVELLLKKPEAPIKADFDFVAVKIRRTRNE